MRLLMALVAVLVVPLVASFAAAAPLAGVNLAGGEFGGPNGVYGKAYLYPDARQMRIFRDMGMTIFRVPVRWEHLQPVLDAPLDAAEMARLDTVVATATGMGATVVIDVHNYARYRGEWIGDGTVPASALRDLWVRLARRYLGNDRVAFGLMNEPIKIDAAAWAAVVRDVLGGIRATGSTNLVLVPGANWSGAHSWTRPFLAGPSNGAALAGLTDPAGKMAFDFHQYFDANSSGTSEVCVTPAEAEARLRVVTDWLRANRLHGMLTEFGVGTSPACAQTLTAVLRHLAANPQWTGWTLWASAAWFGTYKFNLYPFQPVSPPQLATIRPFLRAPTP